VIGVLFLLFGMAFFLIGVIGNVRLPDIFTRLHASGKLSTMGIFGLVVASAFLVEGTAVKAAALFGLMVIAAPVAAQAIARAAFRDGCEIVGLERNDLAMNYIDFPYNYTVGEPVPWQPDTDEKVKPEELGAVDLPPEEVVADIEGVEAAEEAEETTP
jgi:multicomponent Na+:H+ antiporter subunit G